MNESELFDVLMPPCHINLTVIYFTASTV